MCAEMRVKGEGRCWGRTQHGRTTRNLFCRIWTELSERLRLRRGRGDTSEDDEGLPRSPCNSPTTTEGLLEKANIKDHPTKSHSTCSDGSLLSMGSSEDMDVDSFSQQSRHSSKMSLYEKKSNDPDSDLELGPSHTHSAPLNHSAAHHKSKVRPRKTHGAPRRKKAQQIPSTVLPSTPEVNEDSSVRSLTPEVATNREVITELYTTTSGSMSKSTALTETQLKCSSLPPGLAGPGSGDAPAKLSRSCSNAGSKSQDHFGTLEEEEDKEEKGGGSFFERLFPRRSAKKKKIKLEETKVQKTYSSSSYSSTSSSVSTKPVIAPRTGAAARQRVHPIDIPASPDLTARPEAKPSPEKSQSGTSPLQAELESLFRHRNLPATPPKSSERAPRSPVSPKNWGRHGRPGEGKAFASTREMRLEEFRSKMKIAGLSALQQRVLSHNDDEADDAGGGFKSLTDLPTDVGRVNKPVAKSHSFKAVKASFQHSESNRFTYTTTASEKTAEKAPPPLEKRQSIVKAASLDSVKNLEALPIKMETKSETVKQEETFTKTDDVTISGPSHTAVVNVTSDAFRQSENVETEKTVKTSPTEITIKEQQVSVTKIHMKRERESLQTSGVPEFLNRQLNKVENRPSSNVIFKTPSPKIVEEQSKTKTTATVFSFEPETPKRKFSKEDVEIIDKDVGEEIVEVPKTPLVPIAPMTPQSNRLYRKHSESIQRKSSKSESLKSADSSSQDSLDKLEERSDESPHAPTDGVVLRRKSLAKQKAEEEPELMKVFARRSLKLKDSESEDLSQQVKSMIEESSADSLVKSRDSDKENRADSPAEERKIKEFPEARKEPLAETKFVETTEVTLRKPVVANNKFAAYQRTISLTAPKVAEVVGADLKVKKQSSFNERPKTENWFLNLRKSEEEKGEDRKIVSDEIIMPPKSDFINEEEFTIKPKNFNQRKAEWEKRAQEALKKNVP